MMLYDKTQPIGVFLDAAAARQPTPGGGSVAALAGALSAAIGEMVVNYSIAKKDLARHQDQLKHALAELNRARQVMLELMLEDQAAYEALSAIRKLPVNDSQRAGKLDAALLACIRIPQAIGATAAAILRLNDQLVDCTNKYLLSDLAVCAELAMATVRCAAYNVRVNLSDVAEPRERAKFQTSATQQVTRCAAMMRGLIPRIWARQEQA